MSVLYLLTLGLYNINIYFLCKSIGCGQLNDYLFIICDHYSVVIDDAGLLDNVI